MKVVIGGKVYDAVEQPIALILSDDDKKNICNMGKGIGIYLSARKDELEENVQNAMVTARTNRYDNK